MRQKTTFTSTSAFIHKQNDRGVVKCMGVFNLNEGSGRENAESMQASLIVCVGCFGPGT